MSDCELAVVVTTYNRALLLDEVLACLAKQTWLDGSWEIVVVDNNSTDETSEVLRGWEADMPVQFSAITAADRQGPSYARNVGAASTQAVSVAFVDDDDLVGDGWVAAIGTSLREHSIVGSKFDHYALNAPEICLLYTSPSPRDQRGSRMPSSA